MQLQIDSKILTVVFIGDGILTLEDEHDNVLALGVWTNPQTIRFEIVENGVATVVKSDGEPFLNLKATQQFAGDLFEIIFNSF